MSCSLWIQISVAVAQVRERRRVQEVSLLVLMTIMTRCSVDSRKGSLLQPPQLHTLMVAVAELAADQP